MTTISIIVPFAGSTQDLIPDLKLATEGCELIIVDNASDEGTREALQAMNPTIYIRNETNLGFAAGNNQGYARATGDVIMFLNSDVAAAPGWLRAVAADVRPNALYGPSLQAQLVAGRHLPYLEGWCVAGTKTTWDFLTMASHTAHKLNGPWDDLAYPGPYWEDNDLCLRAFIADLEIRHTQWQVQHKGGRTAGPIMRHGESFARNERTFTERVLKAMPQINMTPTWQRYMQNVYTQSDIQHHLGLLYSLAKGNVLELGTRTGVSTSALLAGVEARGGKVISIDIDPRCESVAKDHPLWAFWPGSSTDADMAQDIATYAGPFDLLLIDTEHNWSQVTAELTLWAPHMRPGGRILLHDPETFPGVRRAVMDFCSSRGYPVTFILPCNGMAVIEVPK